MTTEPGFASAVRPVRLTAYLLAFSTAALVAVVLIGVDGAISLVADDSFGLGHIPAYISAAVLGALTIVAAVWVFRSALAWERTADDWRPDFPNDDRAS